jgi:hypothetical protein
VDPDVAKFCGDGVCKLDADPYELYKVPLSKLPICKWKDKCVEAPSAHYVTNKEWNYFMLYMYTNMEEVEPYFEKFDKTYLTPREQPTLKQLSYICEHGLKGGPSFLKWFHQYVIYLFELFLS